MVETTQIQARHKTTGQALKVLRGSGKSSVHVEMDDGRRIVVPWALVVIEVGE